MSQTRSDVLIVGGGIGGAAAALRAAQYQLNTVWATGDKRTAKASRGKYVFNIDNMIGVHPGIVLSKVAGALREYPDAREWLDGAQVNISTQDIVDNVAERVQADHSEHVDVSADKVVSLRREAEDFVAELGSGELVRARNVVLSTGVMDAQPSLKKTMKSGKVIDDVRWIYPYANLERVLYCIRCEGHLTRGEPLAVIGATETTAQVAMMLHERYGGSPVLLTNGEDPTFEEETRTLLEHYEIEVLRERIVDIHDRPEDPDCEHPALPGELKGSQMHGLELESGQRVRARFAMVAMGLYRVYNDLAQDLGAELEAGSLPPELKHVLVEDHSSETSVRGLFCVGDMARRRDGGPLMKQVYTAQEYAVRAVDTLERRARKERREALLRPDGPSAS